MLAKIWTSATILLALSHQAHGHAAISPAIGVSGAPGRSDAKRPSTANPCGARVNIATALDSATPVTAAADGTFTTTVTNFNRGRDGSRQVSAKVDATGTGTSFVAATVLQNGNGRPTDTGSEQIVASLPAGTTCTGGASGNMCLVQFTTTGRFGNCVAVQQGAAGSAGTDTDTTGTTDTGTGTTAIGTATATGTGTGTIGTGGNGVGANSKTAATAAAGNGGNQNRVRSIAAGTRAPGALLAAVGTRGEEAVQVVKHGITSWIWA